MSATTLPPARPRPADLVIAIALALLLGLQPLSTDLYLPALPGIKVELGASMRATQQTMAALLLAFGFGQLVWGAATRRPVSLWRARARSSCCGGWLIRTV